LTSTLHQNFDTGGVNFSSFIPLVAGDVISASLQMEEQGSFSVSVNGGSSVQQELDSEYFIVGIQISYVLPRQKDLTQF